MTEPDKKRLLAIDAQDWNILSNTFGQRVPNCIKHHTKSPEKTSTGAYIIPNAECLKKCSAIYREKLKNVQSGKSRKRIPTTQTYPQKSPYEIPENLRLINQSTSEPKFKTNQAFQVQKLNVATNTKICFSQAKNGKAALKLEQQKIRNNSLHFSKHMRHIAKHVDCETILKEIIQTEIGIEIMTGHESCFKKLLPILEDFLKYHKKFNYAAALRSIVNTIKLKEEKKSEKSSRKNTKFQETDRVEFWLQKYFAEVMHSVVPLALFGNDCNVKKIRNGLKAYMISPHEDEITLLPFIKSLNISAISWLGCINNSDTQWSIIAKLVKWLFERFFTVILKEIFHVKKNLHSEAKIFFSAEEWKRVKKSYIRRLQRKAVIEKIQKEKPNCDEDQIVPCGRMIMFPKKKGVRPILRIEYNDAQTEDVKWLRILLQQLYWQQYETLTLKKFHSVWLSYISRKTKEEKSNLHLVSCDIADAYGSINHLKLFDIVNAMIAEVPDEILSIRWLAVLPPVSYRSTPIIEYKPYFTCCGIPRIKSRALVARIRDGSHKTRYISKKTILNQLKAYIMHQTFQIRDTKYVLKRGIVQGSRLSPILSDIYYAHMTVQEFGIFMKSGTLLRYADDFLYITTDKEWAERFLKAITREIRQYNCRFQSSKTRTTIKSISQQKQTQVHVKRAYEYVSYVGYSFDIDTLDVCPDYVDLTVHYSKWLLYVPCHNSEALFKKRLLNMATLKLSSIVLDMEINKFRAITKTASMAADVMASRCAFLVSTIFAKTIPPYHDVIITVIQMGVNKLVNIFWRHLFNKHSVKQRIVMINRIRFLIWKSFCKIFARNVKLRVLLPDLKRLKKKIDC